MNGWQQAQDWERDWWGLCANTYGEETKQLEYAPKMGLKIQYDCQGPFLDMAGASVLDIGAGPVSLLLKCRNVRGAIVEPCEYPAWVWTRYEEAGITCCRQPAEDYDLTQVCDEAWIYNVLQHVQDPEKVARVARANARIVRVFDWLEIAGEGHPHYLTEEAMNAWFGGIGKRKDCEYYGIFKGDHYGE